MKKIIETSPTFNFSTNEGKNEAKKELLRLLSSAIDNEPWAKKNKMYHCMIETQWYRRRESKDEQVF